MVKVQTCLEPEHIAALLDIDRKVFEEDTPQGWRDIGTYCPEA